MSARPRFIWAGLLVGPLAWAASTQLGYALTPWGCDHGQRPVPFVTALCFVLALAASLWSWRAWRALVPERETERLIAAISAALALLLALVIAMQFAAGLFLGGCEE